MLSLTQQQICMYIDVSQSRLLHKVVYVDGLDWTKACYRYKHLIKASLEYLRFQDFQVIHFLHSNCIRNWMNILGQNWGIYTKNLFTKNT